MRRDIAFVCLQSGGIPLICFPIYKMEKRKTENDRFPFCVLQTFKRKKKITSVSHY